MLRLFYNFYKKKYYILLLTTLYYSLELHSNQPNNLHRQQLRQEILEEFNNIETIVSKDGIYIDFCYDKNHRLIKVVSQNIAEINFNYLNDESNSILNAHAIAYFEEKILLYTYNKKKQKLSNIIFRCISTKNSPENTSKEELNEKANQHYQQSKKDIVEFFGHCVKGSISCRRISYYKKSSTISCRCI